MAQPEKQARNVRFEIEEELKEAFEMFANDANGQITVDELGKVMQKMGQKLSEKELKSIIKRVDQNGSGAINYNDFKSMMQAQLEQTSSDDEIRQAFELFDKNKDGKISHGELKEMLILLLGEDLSDQDVKDMINEADQTGDGHINFNEFKRM
eukprot:754945_1